MIELYARGTTNFSKSGLRIHPEDAEVTYTENGQWDMELTMPADGDYTDFDYGQILRVTVPYQHLDAITLGEISYWTVTNEEGTKLYSECPKSVRVSYGAWVAQRSYMAGNKVTYDKKNYRCVTGHGGRNVPPPDGGLWTRIADSTMTTGTVLTELTAGTVLMKVADFNDEYMEVATTTGYQGYVKTEDCADSGETGTRTIPARTIETQLFVITEVKKNQSKRTISVSAEHISYQLGRTMLGECNVVNVTPATAMMFIMGAMKEAYSGDFYTNISGTDQTITADWSWKNAQSAILDPKNGLVSVTDAQLIRDNLDIIILAEDEDAVPTYTVRYGANMKDVTWSGNVDNLITRIYPIAKTEDGRTLLLPEEHIDTARVVPFVRPETLNTGLKVGDEEEASDGTKTTLTEDDIYSRMRTQAAERFTIDKADRAEVSLELDWLHMPDTVEYKQYAALQNMAPGEYVLVYSAPLGISEKIRMTGYVWNPLTETYKSGKFGLLKTQPTVASYNIASGAVRSTHIASNSISSEHIVAKSITATEIAAGSITADCIASKQITADQIMAEAITADEIAARTITAEKIAAGAITAYEIAAHAVTADKIDAGAITAEKIDAGAITAEKIAAGAITADKIAAGAITAVKIAAEAITADKIAAAAVTADKIDAGAISADKIDTTDLAAINATLGTATIARAEIASADINYAHVKDLTADTAIFSTSITETGVADRLYINRLLITYGQMVEATIGDLVIGASDGYYYHVDVEWDEDEVPTLVPTRVDTPTSAEISAGHTSDGKTIIGNVGTFAELSSEDFYAINGIIDRITAKRIDVDELWARQAFIDKLMVQDISSNTYIQSTIGNWQSQSTITQTVAGLESRISSLGYGTIYYSTTEPDPSGLVVGDIWVQPLEDHVWQEYTSQEWQDILDEGDWGSVMGAYKVYTWSGQYWKTLFDSTVNVEMWTAIEQNTAAIALKASQSDLNILSGEITEFAATLQVQAEEISAAVSAVNTKASTYVMYADPRTVYTVTLGDIWIKTQEEFGSWLQTQASTWQTIKSYKWEEALGGETFVWDGSKWVQTADRATEIYQATLIDQTATQISLMAETTARLQNESYELRASLTIANDRISAEVSRATTAEGGKIDKTAVYQTADAIVTEAVSEATSAAEGSYIKKTSTYQTADAIVTEAVSRSNTAADSSYIKKTTTYQTADAIVTEAVSQAEGAVAGSYIAKTSIYQTAESIVLAAESYTDSNAYAIQSGIEIKSAGIEISGSKYVKIKSGGKFLVDSGKFSIDASGNVSMNGTITSTSGSIGGWSLTSSQIASGSGSSFVKLDSDTSHIYAIYCGHETAASAPFRVKRDGSVALTKLLAIGEDNTETEVNLRTAGLWKLGYATVKSISATANSLTITTTSGSTTVNFKTAADVSQDYTRVSGGYNVNAYLAGEQASTLWISNPSSATWSSYWFSDTGISVTCTVNGTAYTTSFSR